METDCILSMNAAVMNVITFWNVFLIGNSCRKIMVSLEKMKSYVNLPEEFGEVFVYAYAESTRMSLRGGAKLRRGNLPAECLCLHGVLMDRTRRLPRPFGPRNDSGVRRLARLSNILPQRSWHLTDFAKKVEKNSQNPLAKRKKGWYTTNVIVRL